MWSTCGYWNTLPLEKSPKRRLRCDFYQKQITSILALISAMGHTKRQQSLSSSLRGWLVLCRLARTPICCSRLLSGLHGYCSSPETLAPGPYSTVAHLLHGRERKMLHCEGVLLTAHSKMFMQSFSFVLVGEYSARQGDAGSDLRGTAGAHGIWAAIFCHYTAGAENLADSNGTQLRRLSSENVRQHSISLSIVLPCLVLTADCWVFQTW